MPGIARLFHRHVWLETVVIGVNQGVQTSSMFEFDTDRIEKSNGYVVRTYWYTGVYDSIVGT